MDFDKDDKDDEDAEDEDGGSFQRENDGNSEIGSYQDLSLEAEPHNGNNVCYSFVYDFLLIVFTI